MGQQCNSRKLLEGALTKIYDGYIELRIIELYDDAARVLPNGQHNCRGIHIHIEYKTTAAFVLTSTYIWQLTT